MRVETSRQCGSMNPDGRFGERYNLDRKLWCDGPHAGWVALDRLLGRRVVVNFPYRRDHGSEFLKRARLRATLRHANLIPIYDLGHATDGTPFFTEPHIEATDLRTLLRRDDERSGTTLPQLVSYLRDACQAVAFLHANGFLHLGLFPSNVVVTPAFGEVFVLLAHQSLTPIGALDTTIGTGGLLVSMPAYMAPEQLNPEALGPIDVVSDVYALGGILFEILYDRPPNGEPGARKDEVSTALATRNGPPPRRTLADRAARSRRLAQKLEPICLRALEHDRRLRQTSVSDFIEDLEDASTG